MKRLLCVFFVLMILLSACPWAYADDEFTLRDGILFGDTIEDIDSKISSLKKVSSCKQYDYLYCEETWKKQAFKKYPDNATWYNGTILGWPNMDCGFFFQDDKLVGMDYSFPFTSYSSDAAVACYKDIRDSLIKKYGDALNISEGYSFILTGPAFERKNRISYLSAWEYSSKVEEIDSKEWFIEKDSFYVKIDLVIYTYSKKSVYDIFIDLSYQMFTPEEYEAAIQKNQAAGKAKDDEL